MRSLWRVLALQWLGGVGSEALEGEATILELFFGEPVAAAADVFDVRREPGVSHRAMMAPNAEHRPDPASAIQRTLGPLNGEAGITAEQEEG